MATTSTTINQADGWVLITSAAEALIQCRSGGGILKISLAASTPAVDTENYHTVGGGEYFTRIGTDNVYVASDYDGAVVTVST